MNMSMNTKVLFTLTRIMRNGKWFFHEIFGHRAEGHRVRQKTDGQTFLKKVNEYVLPEGFNVTFDPTIYKYDDILLNTLRDDDTASHEEALVRLLYVATEQNGALLLTGGVGCGKTLISRVFINELSTDRFDVALITNKVIVHHKDRTSPA